MASSVCMTPINTVFESLLETVRGEKRKKTSREEKLVSLKEIRGFRLELCKTIRKTKQTVGSSRVSSLNEKLYLRKVGRRKYTVQHMRD